MGDGERAAQVAAAQRVELLLRSALERLEAGMESRDAKETRQLLDHNENGLAIETLLWSVADRKLVVDGATGDLIDQASTEMGGEQGLWRLPLAELVERMKSKGFV